MTAALSRTEVRILEALLAAFYGEGERADGLPASAAATGSLERALGYLAAMRWQERAVVKISLRLLDLAGLRHGARFHRLGPDRRVECLARLANSRFYPRRVQYLFLKTLCLMAIYSSPETHRAMGYKAGA